MHMENYSLLKSQFLQLYAHTSARMLCRRIDCIPGCRNLKRCLHSRRVFMIFIWTQRINFVFFFIEITSSTKSVYFILFMNEWMCIGLRSDILICSDRFVYLKTRSAFDGNWWCVRKGGQKSHEWKFKVFNGLRISSSLSGAGCCRKECSMNV